MVNSIEDIVELHKNHGLIEDAYIKIHLDEKILNLNLFTMQVNTIQAEKSDLEIWQDRINEEIKKDRQLEKEINEFITIFEYLQKFKIKRGEILKSECPDFIIKRDGKTTGIEITKIYVGYDWLYEKLSNEIAKYKIKKEEIAGYIEYRKATDKVETYKLKHGKFIISPKISPIMNEEYQISIKNKIFEKIRKLLDDYCKCDINIIYANITSPEYLEDITDLDGFVKEIQYYMAHLDADLSDREYKLVLKMNQKWIEINLNEGSYKVI
jgi:hypothetical protein